MLNFNIGYSECQSRIKIIVLLLFVAAGCLFAQGKPYEGPDDPAGDLAAIREGWMTGNRVLIYFVNTTKIAAWPNWDTSKWPNDFTGTGMIDDMKLIIGAKVYVRNDSIPVDDPQEIASSTDLQTLYYAQVGMSLQETGFLDLSPDGTVPWTLYPVFGYFNEKSEYPAMSNRPESWPPAGWPARGNELKWPGEWDGRFGRGVKYADLETYFVANDAQDQEYLGPEDTVKYYPRPGVRIGDKLPDVTVQKGLPWGGLGLRVKTRGYQWNNPQARDAVFWEFDISNISDYNLTESALGFYLDNGIGHKGNQGETDDVAFFDVYTDMAYSWDNDGVGVGGIPTGVLGIAFLESPGIPYDQIDNDDDGLIDEARDNVARNIVGPTDGISDLNKFMKWYGYTSVDQLRPHWDADEDQDWDDGDDANGNGVYDFGEYYGDDVGLDGVGPNDLNYTGPDEGECNHKPDFLIGYGSEPDFGPTDISESDMLGLTSFEMFPHPGERKPQVRYDEDCYNQIAQNKLVEFTGTLENLYESFGSAPFPLLRGSTERISVSELHSYEELAGLKSSSHSAPALFQKKKIVQFIYENDYRFAQPPLMPTLKAVAGDGQVLLTWNSVADRLTREPMLGGVNDFEGYKLYKSTDRYFSDAELLRDMFGNPIGKKPIFQCDKKDNIKGAADFVHINGELFYLGDDTGIQHYFIDKDVQNGRTYYYGLVAFDYGYEGLEVSIMPAENNVVVELDETENIRFIGKNVQVVTPHQKAAGYVEPGIEISGDNRLTGDGDIVPQILDIQAVRPNHQYKVKFLVDTLGYARKNKVLRHPMDLVRVNNGIRVYDVTRGDSLVYEETPEHFAFRNILNDGEFRTEDNWNRHEEIAYLNNNEELHTDLFDGVQLSLRLKAFVGELDEGRSGWIKGHAPINVEASLYESGGFPYEYDIIFTDSTELHGGHVSRPSYVFNLKGSTGTQVGGAFIPFEVILGEKFPFYVVNRMSLDSLGNPEELDIIVEDMNNNGQVDILQDRFLAGHYIKRGNYNYWCGTIFGFDFFNVVDIAELPEPGDVYHVSFSRPFAETDSLMFTVLPAVEVEKEAMAGDMEQIKVVPNPYVITNTMEPAVSNWDRNQRRQIMFTHIPAQCTISIFTVGGVLVDQIQVNNSVESRENAWDLNSPANGTAHWDLRSKEGLEIAAGYYIYHVESALTGDVKIGKFAVIK